MPITSSASISSEMRFAPSSAVKPAPTWAARATPKMIGATSRVLPKLATRPVNDSAPRPRRLLKPSMPTVAPVANDIAPTTKIMPLPATSAPGPTTTSLIWRTTSLR